MKLTKKEHMELCVNLYLMGDLIGALIDAYPQMESKIMTIVYNRPMLAFSMAYTIALKANKLTEKRKEYVELRLDGIEISVMDKFDILPYTYHQYIIFGLYKGKLFRGNDTEKIIDNVCTHTKMTQRQIAQELGVNENTIRRWATKESKLSAENRYKLEKLIFDKCAERSDYTE